MAGAERMSYGARAINEGGVQSWPDLAFSGGLFIGCSAGMVNVPRIKGTHNAMKSGMLGAEAVVEAIIHPETIKNSVLVKYNESMRGSWVWNDLYAVRNIKPLIAKFGTRLGMIFGGMEMWLASFRLYLPWTLHHRKADHETLIDIKKAKSITYPKPDNIITFDKLNSISLSNIGHEANQPCHLQLLNEDIPTCLLYTSPSPRDS